MSIRLPFRQIIRARTQLQRLMATDTTQSSLTPIEDSIRQKVMIPYLVADLEDYLDIEPLTT